MPTRIVYAFDDFQDLKLERKVFDGQDVEFLFSHGLESAESRAVLQNADVLVVTLQRVSADTINAMPHCFLISRLGVGIDTIDVAAATAHNMWVTNVPDYGVDEVATHAISLALAMLRGLPTLINNTRAGLWSSQGIQPVQRLTELTLGVMGYGRIGRTTGAKGAGLGMHVIAYDPFLTDEQIRAAGAEPATMDDLFAKSDVISLHLPLDAKTRHIINARTLGLMKPSAYLVNTARGGLVDEAALLEAVNANKIGGAALDVLSTEPPNPDDQTLAALIKHDKVIVTPHMAWYSEQARVDMRTRGAEDIVRVLKGERPRTPVNDIKK